MQIPHHRPQLLLLLVFIVSSAIAGEVQTYANLQSISYSEPVSISAIIRDWDSPFKGGDKALTINRAEFGVSDGSWQFGVIARYDFLMTFSEQTAELYYLTVNHLPLEAGKQYPLHLEVRSQFSRGLRLGYQRQWTSSLKAGVAVSYLQGLALTEGAVNGSAQVTAATDYDFQFDTNYLYSHDVLFRRNVQVPLPWRCS